MILARPLLGFGLGTFQDRSGPYFEQNENFPLTNTNGELHNLFLSLTRSWGWSGPRSGCSAWSSPWAGRCWSAARPSSTPGESA